MMTWFFSRSPLDAIFENIWNPSPWVSGRRRQEASFPAVNVWQSPDDIVLTAEIPGVQAEDLHVSVEGDTLKLSGRRRALTLSEVEKLHRRERGTGEFSRVLTLPCRLDPTSVDATYERGVLRVRAKRAAEDRPRRIEVKSA